ncbi:hypothetical protein DYB36_009360 [Aphanomyces astaci]|uniref:asparaginase n=2 Tax=Aphanomyces astaci TaxID=112090 RepID=A0A397BCK4_APHAT|nr:hypothetical protein DYB36_009360 [Aphanomyces astaci]
MVTSRAAMASAQDEVPPLLPTPLEVRALQQPEKVVMRKNSLGRDKHEVLTDARVLILYTGGTFGMAPDAVGTLHPKSGFLEQKVKEMDEFKFGGMPKVTIIEWEDPIDSSDMSPADWGRIAQTIEEHYWDYDGFVVLQGTDTMAYTASALSFMLESLGKLVVISGAMIPLHFPHSDARRNLIMSVLCAASLEIPEVCIYSNDKLLRGNRTTKTFNMAVDAFHSPNHPVLALTGVETILEHGLILPYPRRRFSAFTKLHTNICVFHLVPGFDDDCITAYIEKHKRDQPGASAKAMSCVTKLAYLMGKGYRGPDLKLNMETVLEIEPHGMMANGGTVVRTLSHLPHQTVLMERVRLLKRAPNYLAIDYIAECIAAGQLLDRERFMLTADWTDTPPHQRRLTPHGGGRRQYTNIERGAMLAFARVTSHSAESMHEHYRKQLIHKTAAEKDALVQIYYLDTSTTRRDRRLVVAFPVAATDAPRGPTS